MHLSYGCMACIGTEYVSCNAVIVLRPFRGHYNDVIMGTIAFQITSLTIVHSTVYSDADRRKHQSSAWLAFVPGIHREPVNSSHKWPVTQKMFPFDDVIMKCGTMALFTSVLSPSVQAFVFRSVRPAQCKYCNSATEGPIHPKVSQTHTKNIYYRNPRIYFQHNACVNVVWKMSFVKSPLYESTIEYHLAFHSSCYLLLPKRNDG